jgi:hypothetical protein
MTASPSTSKRSEPKITPEQLDVVGTLDELFSTAIYHSARLRPLEEDLRARLGQTEDLLSDYMLTIATVLAEIAEPAIETAREIAELFSDASDALSGAREGLVVERVMRPIFAAAGRADDLAAPEEHPPLRDIVATRAPADAQWDPAGTR